MTIAVTDFADVARVELLDLEMMPRDRVAIYAAKCELSTRDYGVWTKLREHLWEYGSLPVGLRALAKIAGIGAASLERAAPKLARHFDRTEHGAWTDCFLMGRRGTSLVVPSPEAPAVNPSLSAARRASGAAGGAVSGARRAEAAAARRANGGGGGGGPFLLQAEAKSEANAQANGGGNPSRFASDFACRGEANASLAPGWLVGFSPEFSSKTNQPTARASEAKPEAKPGEAEPDEAKPACGGDEAPPDAAGEADARMVRAIVAACPGKIGPGPARWGLKAVKEWIAKGCSFEADYLPTLQAFASTNRVIKNAANDFIKSETFASRDRRLTAAPAAAGRRPDPASMSTDERQLHAELESRLGADVYLSWFSRLRVVSFANGVATLAVPTKFIRTYISANLSRDIEAAAKAARPEIGRIELEVMTPG